MDSPIYIPDVGAKNSHSIESLNNVIFDPSLRVHYPMNGQVAISQPLIFIVYRLFFSFFLYPTSGLWVVALLPDAL